MSIRLKVDFSITLALAALSVGISEPAGAAAQYSDGYQWKRSAQYQRGTISGSSLGNPNVDSLGSPVWYYGFNEGGSLSSSDPWIFNGYTPSVWDEKWLGGRWGRQYVRPGRVNGNPPVGQFGMTHDFSIGQFADRYMPIVEWINPTGTAGLFDIGGGLRLKWAGRDSSGSAYSPDIPAEIAIVAISAAGVERVLFSRLIDNPHPGPYSGAPDQVGVRLSFDDVRLGDGEALRFSVRGQSGPVDPLGWITFNDNVTITYNGMLAAVPEAHSGLAILFGLCGIALAIGRTARAKLQ